MKTIITAILFLFNLNIGLGQTSNSWYKVFTGEFGNMNATLHLHKSSDDYSGYIWFDKLQWPMQIYGSQKIDKTDSIHISAGSGPMTVNLTGILTDGDFKGYGSIEKNNSSSKKAKFQLAVNSSGDFTSFDYYFSEGHATLPPKLKNESTCDYSIATIWPKENNTLSKEIKKEVSSLLGSKTTVTNPESLMNTEKNKFISSWQKDNNKLTPKDASEMGLSLTATQDEKIMVMYENPATITLADYSSEYSGGAHNNYATTLICINKKSGRKLSLTDVLTTEGIKLLPAFLDRVARLQYGITNQKPLDQNYFLVHVIKPSTSFYTTSQGIGFLYAPYEIKSFADGEVNLLVPYSVLEKYLKPEFKKL
jgi:hypothetical protein